jgi:hypothetical protein
VPENDSTSGKIRQNGLSKKGDRYLRSLLVKSLIRTHLANHIGASSREEWLHQQARHMTAPLCRARHKGAYADRRTMPNGHVCGELACDRLGIVCPLPPHSTAEERTMIAEEYLSRSRLYRRLRNGSHGELVSITRRVC